MKLQYCKPETEVDLLDLEECILSPITPTIVNDMDDPDDPNNAITW